MAKSISTKGSKKKSTPKKKTTGSKTAPASAKTVQQAEKPEEDMASPDSAAKPLSISELVLKKFDGWHPPQMFIPPADDSPAPVAPPFVSDADPREVERITALLFRTFDLKADIALYEAERLAAEKAEAERLAAEKAEAERIAAEQRKKAIKAQQAGIPKVTITNLQETPQNKEPEPMNNAVKLAAGGLGLLIILLLGFSFSNSHNYYLKPVKNGVEIWQGRFAPKGEKRLIALPGVQVSKTLHDVCTQEEVYPVIFKYYLDKADAIISKPGIPDFEGIKHMIALAQPYAITRNLRDEAALRLNRMEQAMLEYKADIAASKGNAADLKTALDLLDKAKALNIDTQTGQLDAKIADITARLKNQITPPASTPAGK